MRKILWPLAAIIWLLVLALPLGPLPPLGKLLDFHAGIWAHRDFKWQDLHLKGLKNPVQVAIDSSGVPHLFAQNESDLYFAQGYIMASQRLFQMDLSTRSTSGHLAELVGDKGLVMDRFFVKFGMRQSVLKTTNDYMSNPHTAEMLSAFTAGVNSYIQSLTELPIEYKLLDQRPQPFDVSRIVQMARALTFSLTSGGNDYLLSHLRETLPVAKVLDLFPEFMPPEYSDYIFPGPWSKSKRAHEKPEDFKFVTHIKNFPDIPSPSKGNGSNNFVIGPAKSKTGHSILANDTHLDYSLPDIWFENQLSCPEFNTYGVSLPDVPGVVAGFTNDIAWGPTNGTTDALDYYEVEFTDDTHYLDHGQSNEAQVFPETITSSSGHSEPIDVVWTKWGPVIYREGRYGLVANWTGFTTKEEFKALRSLYDAHSAKECLDAFNTWNVPIQNWACADADNFGLTHGGLVPKRAIGEGRFIEQPTTTALQVSVERPTRLNPKEGYLRSANQRVVDDTFPNYMGWDYEEPFRGMRIRQLIEAQEKLNGEDLIRIQNDDYDLQAEMALPTLLKVIARDKLSIDQLAAIQALEKWDFHADAGKIEPSIYKSWFETLKYEIFHDDINLSEKPTFYPKDIRVIEIIKRVAQDPTDSDAEWIDDKMTPETETLSDIVTHSFKKSWSKLSDDLGSDSKRWTWQNYNVTKIPHVARLAGFGSSPLRMNGAGESVRSNRGKHGPVYKFVIELGPNRRAWMQVPGGESGDPLSPEFERNVKDWSQGVMRPVELYKDVDEAKAKGAQIIQLTPGEG